LSGIRAESRFIAIFSGVNALLPSAWPKAMIISGFISLTLESRTSAALSNSTGRITVKSSSPVKLSLEIPPLQAVRNSSQIHQMAQSHLLVLFCL